MVLLPVWLVALLVALSQAPVWGWGSGRVIGLLVVAVAVCAAWIFAEMRSAVPLIDMRMMRLPAVWTTNLVALLVGLSMYATFAFLPELLQTPKSSGYGFGASITQSGLILLPSSVTMFVLGQYSGRLTARFGGRALVVAGSVIGALSMAMIAFAHDHSGRSTSPARSWARASGSRSRRCRRSSSRRCRPSRPAWPAA